MFDYHERHEGLIQGLREILDNKPDVASYVSTLRILDYFQYTNPPYLQKHMGQALGEPQSKISQLVDALIEKGVRIRLDFSHIPLGLKPLVVIFEGMKTESLPLPDWIGSAYRIPRGIIAFYRVPFYETKKTVEVIQTRVKMRKMSDSNVKVKIYKAHDTLLARPSLEYWLYRVFEMNPGLEKIDPINAFNFLESHPERVEGYEALSLGDIDFNPGDYSLEFRDQTDLAVLAAMERDIFYAKSHNTDDIIVKKFTKPRSQAVRHEQHITRIARGSRVMAHDTDYERGNSVFIFLAEGSNKSIRFLVEDLKRYPYAYSLLQLDHGGLLFTIIAPIAYMNTFALEVESRYGVEITHMFQVTIKDFIDRRLLPFRNYDHANRRWAFLNDFKVVILNYLRGYILRDMEIEESLEEYINRIKGTSEEAYFIEAIRELGFRSVDELLDEYKRILDIRGNKSRNKESRSGGERGSRSRARRDRVVP